MPVNDWHFYVQGERLAFKFQTKAKYLRPCRQWHGAMDGKEWRCSGRSRALIHLGMLMAKFTNNKLIGKGRYESKNGSCCCWRNQTGK